MKMSVNCSIYLETIMEKKYDSAMPIIGLYVAAASLICSSAMFFNLVADLSGVFLGQIATWLILNTPPKFFSLNATWLTLIAVATKLTGDLTTPMSPGDNYSKGSSAVFLTLAMGNFFTSLGSMNDTYILTNLTALSILVATIVVDLCIQLRTNVLDSSLSMEIILELILLVCMFITIVCSALAVPAIKKRAESKYQKLAASDEKQMEAGQQHYYTVEELRLRITKYWVMAVSGSPPSLMKRLVTFVFTSIICIFSPLIFHLGLGDRYEYQNCYKESDYKRSIESILWSHYLALYPLPIIMAIFLLRVLSYKYENNEIKISREEFAIESYWTEKLVECRQSSIPMRGFKRWCRKLVHNIKCLILTYCVRLQTMIIIWCKFCYVLFFYSMLPLVLLVNPLGKLINHCTGKLLLHKNNKVSNDQIRKSEVDLNCFVILLEGEKQFSKRLLREIINRIDKLVEKGKKKRPQNLLNLLKQSFSFSGVVAFDSNLVPSLLSGEPPNCWTLPVVTLTSIAIAIPNIASEHVDWLVSSVNEGLRYASLIDVLDEKCGLKSIKNAADVVWVGVELHRKWFDMDVERKTGSAKDIVQDFVDVAERIVKEFSSKENIILVENPLYWPANVLAANSMYRITRTIKLLYYENGECQAEELFRKLICMIADILTACLTNLPHMIATKCRSNAIEERLESVGDAAIIFGETEDILKYFEEHKLSSIGPNQPLWIDEWRGWIEQQATTVSSSTTSNGSEHPL